MLQRACVGGWWWVERCVVLVFRGRTPFFRELVHSPRPTPRQPARARSVARGPAAPAPRRAAPAAARAGPRRHPTHIMHASMRPKPNVRHRDLSETSYTIRVHVPVFSSFFTHGVCISKTYAHQELTTHLWLCMHTRMRRLSRSRPARGRYETM